MKNSWPITKSGQLLATFGTTPVLVTMVKPRSKVSSLKTGPKCYFGTNMPRVHGLSLGLAIYRLCRRGVTKKHLQLWINY